MLLSVKSLEKRYGSETVFSGVSFTLDEGHRVALVGKNGTGKSTLLKIIANCLESESGEIVLTSGRRVAYLQQEVSQDESRTCIEYLQDGSLQPHQFFPVLEGLGISQETASQKIVEMSGGQQTKVLLTRFLLEPSDILLLDEPTNNLDIPSLLWLESFLASSKKAMIIVSHDLVFLNNITNRVLHLKDGTLTTSRGTYGDYLEREKKEFTRKMKEYNLYRDEVQRLDATKKILQGKGEKIDKTESSDSNKMEAGAKRDRASAGQRQARMLERRVKKMEVVEKPFEEDPFTLSIDTKNTDGDIEIVAEELVAGHSKTNLIGPISFSLKLGERMCLVGMNGVGKSTVLKTIIGDIKPVSGSISISEGVVFGDLMQQHERADRGSTAIDFFIEQTRSDAERALHMLTQAGFTEQSVKQKISGLSSGMRARLLFSVFMFLGVNVLLLDEPTNHLDIDAVSALKEMMKHYKGSVLLVSHNRWFLDGLDIERYYEVVEGDIQRITDFEKYLTDAQERSNKMIARLRRIKV